MCIVGYQTLRIFFNWLIPDTVAGKSAQYLRQQYLKKPKAEKTKNEPYYPFDEDLNPNNEISKPQWDPLKSERFLRMDKAVRKAVIQDAETELEKNDE